MYYPSSWHQDNDGNNKSSIKYRKIKKNIDLHSINCSLRRKQYLALNIINTVSPLTFHPKHLKDLILRFPQFLLNAFGCHRKFHKGSLLDTLSLLYSQPSGQIYSASSLTCWHPYLRNLYSATELCKNLHNLQKRHHDQVQEV